MARNLKGYSTNQSMYQHEGAFSTRDNGSDAKRAAKSQRNAKDGAAGRNAQGTKSGKAASRDDVRNGRGKNDTRDSRDSRDARGKNDTRDSRDSRDARGKNDARDTRSPRDTRSRNENFDSKASMRAVNKPVPVFESPRQNTNANANAGDLIEGRHAVLEAFAAGIELKRIYIAEGIEHDAALESLLKKAQKAGIPIDVVSRAQLDKKSVRGVHQGVMAKVAPYRYATIEELIAKAKGCDHALIIVLDHITDVGNLGAIARTADVVGACGMLIPNARSAEVTAAAQKASAGATAHLTIARESSIAKSLKKLKEAGFWIAGASEHADLEVWDAPFEGRIALVMGSEQDGLSRLVLENCDFLVKLPQEGHIESLNVAQACTALSYEWARRRRNAIGHEA